MPTYSFECPICGREEEEYRKMSEYRLPKKCKCGADMVKGINVPRIQPDADDFSTENGGKGRYNKQLNTYVTSVNDAINKAKSKGMYVLDR